MKGREPKNLVEWDVSCGRLFTCGRPGRGTFSGSKTTIPESIILEWASALRVLGVTHIVSLLGWKDQTELSEFSYYPFRSGSASQPGVTFQEWLLAHHGWAVTVVEFPTHDRRPMASAEYVESIRARIRALLDGGASVVVVDSAGVERTREVCSRITRGRSR
jgi:hypothetical protein